MPPHLNSSMYPHLRLSSPPGFPRKWYERSSRTYVTPGSLICPHTLHVPVYQGGFASARLRVLTQWNTPFFSEMSTLMHFLELHPFIGPYGSTWTTLRLRGISSLRPLVLVTSSALLRRDDRTPQGRFLTSTGDLPPFSFNLRKRRSRRSSLVEMTVELKSGILGISFISKNV